MKRASQSQPEPEPVSRFNGLGITLVTLGLLVILFVFVGPWVERNAHLIELDYLEDPKRMESGLRTLCRTDVGKKELNANLAARDVAERVRIVAVAAKLSCLDELEPGFRAEYYLYDAEHGDVAMITAQGADAVEPAIEALGASEAAPRERAARVLFALAETLDDDQRTRATRRLEDIAEDERGQAVTTLLETLAPPEPPKVEPPPEPVEPAGPDDVDAGQDMNELVLDPALGLSDMGELDAGVLRLDEPLELREPELTPPTKKDDETPGVLFERDAPGVNHDEAHP